MAARPGGRIGIGEVIRRLSPDFPDVTISKIRFLESEGLVEPERSASGYRKFSSTDVSRLRYILSAQRDKYLPLRVIREHLDAIDRGLEPPDSAGAAPKAPKPAEAGPRTAADSTVSLTRAELLANSGLQASQLADLEAFGLVPGPSADGYYGRSALTVATTAAAVLRHGLEPRHLRQVKTTADRQATLIEQVVTPLAHHRGAASVEAAEQQRTELATLFARLHADLLAGAVHTRD